MKEGVVVDFPVKLELPADCDKKVVNALVVGDVADTISVNNTALTNFMSSFGCFN